MAPYYTYITLPRFSFFFTLITLFLVFLGTGSSYYFKTGGCLPSADGSAFLAISCSGTGTSQAAAINYYKNASCRLVMLSHTYTIPTFPPLLFSYCCHVISSYQLSIMSSYFYPFFINTLLLFTHT